MNWFEYSDFGRYDPLGHLSSPEPRKRTKKEIVDRRKKTKEKKRIKKQKRK